MTGGRAAAALALALALLVSPVAAQIPDEPPPGPPERLPPPEAVEPDTVRDTGGAAAGAFLRSLVIPGWGQARYGAYTRGGVYYAVWAGSWLTLARTLLRLGEAAERRDRRFASVLDSLAVLAATDTALARRLENPLERRDLILEDEDARELEKLVNAREEQREDWIAWTAAWTLAAAVDALVTAHLSDFPATIAAEPAEGGGLRLEVRVPLGRRP